MTYRSPDVTVILNELAVEELLADFHRNPSMAKSGKERGLHLRDKAFAGALKLYNESVPDDQKI